MNAKTINKILKRKVNEWVLSINDLELTKKIEKDIIITGGCIASFLMGDDVNDYDVYFKTRETALAVTEYYVDLFNSKNSNSSAEIKEEDERIKIHIQSKGVASEDENNAMLEAPFENAVDALKEIVTDLHDDDGEKEKYRVVFMSSNAITLSDDIQIVIRFFGDPKEIHKNYDFAHCTNYWTYDDGVVTNAEALEALITKELVYMGSKYPLCSIIRTRKFIKRGFHINAGQYLKMFFQLNELDLTDIEVLEDQLIGVDSAYFTLLIDGIKSKMENDPSFKISTPYVVSIIDKIF